MKKRLLLSLLIACSVGFSNVHGEVNKISDIDKSSGFAREAIVRLSEMDVISGDQNGNYYPDKPISRVEFVVLMVKTLKLDLYYIPTEPSFKDVPRNHWAYAYVEAAYRDGIVTGISPTEFGVNNICTREQIAVMFIRALDLLEQSTSITYKSLDAIKDKNNIADWAKREVDVALTAGLMNGVGKNEFAPKNKASKEQAALVFYRLIENKNSIVEKVRMNYGLETKAQLILNGDKISDNFYIVDENNNLFLSSQFINKYFLRKYEQACLRYAGGLIQVNAQEVGSFREFADFWFKPGEKYAYKNPVNMHDGNEYTMFKGTHDNGQTIIPLEFAPFMIGEDFYIAAKDFGKIAGYGFRYDEVRNKTYIYNAFISKYPHFQTAILGGVSQYFGDMDAVEEVTMREVGTSNYTKTYMKAYSRVNSKAIYTDAKIKVVSNKHGVVESAVKQIITFGKIYILDGDNKWFEYTKRYLEDIINQRTQESYSVQIDNSAKILSGSFYMFYDYLPIRKVGTEAINGVTADKYYIYMSDASIKYILLDKEYIEFNKIYKGTAVQEMEFYVVNERIVRLVVRFRGQASDLSSKKKMDITINSNTDFSKIHEDNKIELPQNSNIKLP